MLRIRLNTAILLLTTVPLGMLFLSNVRFQWSDLLYFWLALCVAGILYFWRKHV